MKITTKRIIAKLIIVSLLFTMLPMKQNNVYAASAFQNIYEIYTAEDLKNIENDMYGIYILKNDIDLSTYGEWEPIGYRSSSSFYGKLYGNGYTINNLTISSGSYSFTGALFKDLNGAYIENLGVLDFNIAISAVFLSAIAFNCIDSTIKNVYTTGNESSYFFYGLIYSISNSTLENCYTSVTAATAYGSQTNSTVSGIYYNSDAAGITSTAFGTPQTETELKQEATFEGFDFTNIWSIDEGNSFPTLQSKLISIYGKQAYIDLQKAENEIVFYFTSTPIIGTGNVSIHKSSDDTVIATYDQTQVTIDGNEGTISFSDHLVADTQYYILVDDGLFLNENNKSVLGYDSTDDFTFTALSFLGGNGSEDSPYEIATVAELMSVNQGLDYAYCLTADIDLSDVDSFTPIGNEDNPFTGIFDGQNYGIYYLNIEDENINYQGLFGNNRGEIKNVNVYDANIVIASSSSDAYGAYVAALVGYNTGTVDHSSTTGYIEGRSNVGGLVGNNIGTITDSNSHADVAGITKYVFNSVFYIGGFAGKNSNGGIIERCYATGNVSGDEQVGGFVGNQFYADYIKDCYATGDVSGEAHVGGFAGRNYSSSHLENVYSTGKVTALGTGSTIGGLIGYQTGATLTNGYYDMELSGQSDNDGRGVPLTTVEAKEQDSFSGFDFMDVWAINEGMSTPYLNLEIVNGEMYVDLLNTNHEFKIEFTGVPILANGNLMIYEYDTDSLIATVDEASITIADTIATVNFEAELTEGVKYYLLMDEGLFVNQEGEGILTYSCKYAYTFTPRYFSAGNGTDSSPYEISTIEQLGYVNDMLDYAYVLTNDLSLPENSNWTPIGDQHNPFTGTFDGQDYVISNLIIDGEDLEYQGLFGNNAGVIKNIGVEDVNINVSGSGMYIGGLAGYNSGTIINAHTTGLLQGYSYVGGLVGMNESGAISNSYSEVAINSEVADLTTTSTYFGGLVGQNSTTGEIEKSYALGDVTGYRWIGGFIGYNLGNVTDCYSKGGATGYYAVGGFAGDNTSTMKNIYSNGSVYAYLGTSVQGGLVGNIATTGTLTNGYYDTEKSGLSDTYGGAVLLTTGETRQESSFSGFDFTNTWTIVEDRTTPYFTDNKPYEFPDAINSAPVLDSTYFSVNSNCTTSGALVAIDNDGDDITFTVVETTTHGVLTVSSTGYFEYTPDITYDGEDQATLSLYDSFTTTAATLKIRVNYVAPDDGADDDIGNDSDDDSDDDTDNDSDDDSDDDTDNDSEGDSTDSQIATVTDPRGGDISYILDINKESDNIKITLDNELFEVYNGLTDGGLASSDTALPIIEINVTSGDSNVEISASGANIQAMQKLGAVLAITTDLAKYSLPSNAIDLDAVVALFGGSIDIAELSINIVIGSPSQEMTDLLHQGISGAGLSIIGEPTVFEIEYSYQGTTVTSNKLASYVERQIILADSYTIHQFTTAVKLLDDGTLLHVPTKIEQINGNVIATINSLTNSVYALIYNEVTFGDAIDHWGEDEIVDLASRTIVQGNENGLFLPDNPVTRAEFITMITKGLGVSLVGDEAAFIDVTADDWYYNQVQTGYAYGLIIGNKDEFRPNALISREEACVILERAMNLIEDKTLEDVSILNPYSDATDVSDWAYEAMTLCVQEGILIGNNCQELNPEESLTRAEGIMFIYRLLKNNDLI
jgi:hypothetical protein